MVDGRTLASGELLIWHESALSSVMGCYSSLVGLLAPFREGLCSSCASLLAPLVGVCHTSYTGLLAYIKDCNFLIDVQQNSVEPWNKLLYLTFQLFIFVYVFLVSWFPEINYYIFRIISMLYE